MNARERRIAELSARIFGDVPCGGPLDADTRAMLADVEKDRKSRKSQAIIAGGPARHGVVSPFNVDPKTLADRAAFSARMGVTRANMRAAGVGF